VLDVAAATGKFSHLEIRCDPRNVPSNAVAQRLGLCSRADLMTTTSTSVRHRGQPGPEQKYDSTETQYEVSGTRYLRMRY